MVSPWIKGAVSNSSNRGGRGAVQEAACAMGHAVIELHRILVGERWAAG